MSGYSSRALRRERKSRWAEKSPPNIYAVSAFLDANPNGRVVMIVRDGRDTVASLRRRGFPLADAISIWGLETLFVMAFRDHGRVHVVRYEDLVSDAQQVYRKLCQFLEIGYDPDFIDRYVARSKRLDDDATLLKSVTWRKRPGDGISRDALGRYRDEMSSEDLAIFYGYSLDASVVRSLPPILQRYQGITSGQIMQAFGYDGEAPTGATSTGIWMRCAAETELTAVRAGVDKFQQRFFTFDWERLTPMTRRDEAAFYLTALRAQQAAIEASMARTQERIGQRVQVAEARTLAAVEALRNELGCNS